MPFEDIKFIKREKMIVTFGYLCIPDSPVR